MSLSTLWHVQHLVALLKVIQGPCLVSRDDAYMGQHGDLLYVPCDGGIIVTVVMILKSSSGDAQHYVKSFSFMWPQIHLYNAMSVLFFIQMSVWRMQVYHRLDI